MTTEYLDKLLYEGEGTTLDFKQTQYPFAGATEEQKSELLKDILAFANAWRQQDAHIVIGAKQLHVGRAEVAGVTYHLDDAALQQFVNSKTNRTITFSYEPVTIDSKAVGVITIPVQKRPFYLKADYGKLKAGEVRYRQGSSTAIAKPEELVKMGEDHATQSPLISFEETRNQYVKEFNAKFFSRVFNDNQFHGFEIMPPITTLTLIPFVPLARKLDLARIEDAAKGGINPIGASAWEYGRDAMSFHTFAGNPNPPINAPQSVTEIDEDGNISAAVQIHYTPNPMQHDKSKPVEFFYEQQLVIEAIRTYSLFLRNSCELDAPYHAQLGIFVVNNVVFRESSCNREGGMIKKDSIIPPLATIHGPITDFANEPIGYQSIAIDLQQAFNFVWRSAGLPKDSHYDEGGKFLRQPYFV